MTSRQLFYKRVYIEGLILIKSSNDTKLTSKEYWSKYYAGMEIAGETQPAQAHQNTKPPSPHGYTRNYGSYLWEKFIDKYFSFDETKSVVEVGSAPGTHVVKFSKKFGYKPYGIEYTDDGAELNRAVFRKNGIPEENVIHADFLDPAFQSRYKDFFDIVISSGFLEHFTNPKEVVRCHLNILKPGGLLLISIPNFRYINFALKSFFGKEFIGTHNLDLMDLDAFRDCFDFENLEIVECRYIGGFQFPQPTYTKPWKRIIERLMGKLQLGVNVLFRLLFKDKGWESRYFSVSLVCFGRKSPVQ